MGKEKKNSEEKTTKVVETKTKDYSIEKQDQKRMKGISKFLYVVAKIVKIFAIIGIVGLAIAMIAVPIVTSNIKTTKNGDQNILKIFDNDLYYKRTENSFEIYEKDNENEKTKITNIREVDAINKVFDYLEENDLTKVTLFIEVELALVVVALVLEVFVFSKVYKLFKNIYDESTPFIEENIDLLKNIGKLLIIELIVGIVISMISSIVLNSSFSIRLTNVVEILVVFIFIYIFKYGYNLQKDTKGKIYSTDI